MKHVEELFVKASLNVIITQPNSLVPYDFGSGCIVNYKDRQFFISVLHVTQRGLSVYIEPNQPHDGKTTPLCPVGGIVSYDYLVTKEHMTAEELI
jgi:hypothetical protein